MFVRASVYLALARNSRRHAAAQRQSGASAVKSAVYNHVIVGRSGHSSFKALGLL